MKIKKKTVLQLKLFRRKHLLSFRSFIFFCVINLKCSIRDPYNWEMLSSIHGKIRFQSLWERYKWWLECMKFDWEYLRRYNSEAVNYNVATSADVGSMVGVELRLTILNYLILILELQAWSWERFHGIHAVCSKECLRVLSECRWWFFLCYVMIIWGSEYAFEYRKLRTPLSNKKEVNSNLFSKKTTQSPTFPRLY